MPRSSSAFQIPAFFPLRQHFSRALLCPGALAALGQSLRGAGDAAGAFAPPEMSKSLRETRVSLWTWPMGLSSRHRLPRLLFFTRTPTCTSLLALSRKIFIRFLFFSPFFSGGGPGVYRDPEEAAAVMETAGAETLSVFPSEIPPGAVRLSAAEEVRWFLGRDGWKQQPEGPTRASQVGPVSPNREGWILPGSEPHFGREEGWKSFGNKTPGVGWEGKGAVSLLECVVGAYPTDSHRVPLALNPELPSCTAYPRHWVASFVLACCPLVITSALEFHQKAVNWQKKKSLKPAEGAEPGGCGQKARVGMRCKHRVCSLPR